MSTQGGDVSRSPLPCCSSRASGRGCAPGGVCSTGGDGESSYTGGQAAVQQDTACRSSSCSGSECLQVPHCPEFLKRNSSWVKKKNTPHYSSPQEVYIEKRAEAGSWTDAAMHPPHQTPAPAPRGALWLQRCTCCVDSTSASPTKTQEMPLF